MGLSQKKAEITLDFSTHGSKKLHLIQDETFVNKSRLDSMNLSEPLTTFPLSGISGSIKRMASHDATSNLDDSCFAEAMVVVRPFGRTTEPFLSTDLSG